MREFTPTTRPIITMLHGGARRAAPWVTPLLVLVLGVSYIAAYALDPSRPGQDPAAPLGWSGWFDQSVTLRSVAALAAGNLDQSQHHYPLGYALLGMPGYWIAPAQPFVLVGLASLLGAFAAFVSLARRLGVVPPVSGALFCAATLTDPSLFRHWVLPWNTTPVAALLWALLAAMAAWIAGRRRPVSSGLMLGLLAACRPTEAAIAAIPLAAAAWADLQARRRGQGLPIGDWARLALACMAVIVPMLLLHLAIYGPHPSLYMTSSQKIGFTLHDIAWKVYVVLMNPYSWFEDGHGLFQHRQWYVVGTAGLILSLFGGLTRAMLALTIAADGVLYVSYVDLLPTGLFRFMNVHYFMWAIPGLGLCAALLARDLVHFGRPLLMAVGALAVTGLVLGVRLDPKEVGLGQPAKAIDFDGPLPPFMQTYFGSSAFSDDVGILQAEIGMRVFISLRGIRVIGLKRDIVGPVRWLPGAAPPGFETTPPARRLGVALRWTWPPVWWQQQTGPRIPVPEQ